MKDLTEYIDFILQELNIPLTVSFMNETYFIVFNIKDLRYDNEIVRNIIKGEVDNVINRYIHSLTTKGDSIRVSFFVHKCIVLLSVN